MKERGDSAVPEMTVEELLLLVDGEIAGIQADIEVYEERTAIEAEARDDGLNTEQRALKALEEPDTSWGRRRVARAWLRTARSNGHIFKKNSRDNG